MIQATIELPKDLDPIYIIPFSDLHLGDPRSDIEKFFKYREWMLEHPNAYAILNGDIMNTATKNSKSDIYEDTLNPKQQLELAEKIFTPIKDRILVVNDGNHERRVSKESSVSTSEVLASRLGVRYGGEGCLLYLRVGTKPKNGKPLVYTLYATHGFGGGKKPGGKINNLQSLSTILLADIYIMSHVHLMSTFQDVYYLPDTRTKKMNEVKRTYISSGAYLKWGGYAECGGFAPAKIGSPRIRLNCTKKDVHVSI